jgi:hypothetical protein
MSDSAFEALGTAKGQKYCMVRDRWIRAKAEGQSDPDVANYYRVTQASTAALKSS